ncbi:hypothetical protein HGRIS_005370 [Hohenbuehelia grisea]|uniref:PH domain-containing protein n=1 Tax=Hohenbuehelia grisea TaxID=104357 RepID=A0ABR3JFP5_9AGAR
MAPPLECPKPERTRPLKLKGRVWMTDLVSVDTSYDDHEHSAPKGPGQPPKQRHRTGVLPLTLHFQPDGALTDDFTLWFGDEDEQEVWRGAIEKLIAVHGTKPTAYNYTHQRSISFDDTPTPMTHSPCLLTSLSSFPGSDGDALESEATCATSFLEPGSLIGLPRAVDSAASSLQDTMQNSSWSSPLPNRDSAEKPISRRHRSRAKLVTVMYTAGFTSFAAPKVALPR